MSFSYTINTGKISGTDPYAYGGVISDSYLVDVYGIDSTNYTGSAKSSGFFIDSVAGFSSQYQSVYGKSLNISDGYKFFEGGNELSLSCILNGTGEVSYTSGSPVTFYDPTNISRNVYDQTANNTVSLSNDYTSIIDRVSVYKEMFLELLGKPGSTSLNVTSAYSGITFNGYVINSTMGNTPAQLTSALAKLEEEANLLEPMIYSQALDYGGYPEIPYETNDPEIELLERQLDAATQQFVKLYDDFFGYYKTKAGETNLDNDAGGNADNDKKREQEAATAAIMTATLALNYAQETYSQTIKPEAPDYIFGQAPILFKNGGTGTPAAQVDDQLLANLKYYVSDSNAFLGNFVNLFAGRSGGTADNDTGFVATNIIYSNTDETVYTYDTTTGGGFNKEGIDSISGTYNYKLTDNQQKEIGESTDEYINWMVRDAFGVGGLTTTIKDTVYCGNGIYLAKDIIAAAEKMVDLKMQIMTITTEAAINNKVRAEYEARLGAIEAIEKVLYCPSGTDPYTLTIDGQKYMLGQDQDDNRTIDNATEILGINDTQENMFESLKKLDVNNDGYVSQEEMKTGNIILNAINENGALTASEYDMNLIKGISLASLQSIGVNFGNFTMDLQNGNAVVGDLTYEESDYFNKLFGRNSSTTTTPNPETSTTDSSWTWGNVTKSTQIVTTTEPAATTNEEPVTEGTEDTDFSIDDSGSFSFDLSDASDNKSPIEQLFDQICWKMGINNLSSSQRINIIDNVDATQDMDIAEYEIRQDLEALNLSA